MSANWLLAPITGQMKKADLQKFLNDIPPEVYGDGPTGTTKADILSFIRSVRAAHWNEQNARTMATKQNGQKRAGKYIAADLCQLSAAQINQWLRTLPPPPLAGEQDYNH